MATRMFHKHTITALVGILAGAPVLAQQESAGLPDSCTIEPIFHCAEPMDDGSIIGHFGYNRLCPGSDKVVEDVYISIGEDNYFSPDPIDRGQPKVFMLGEHVDEFEAEFTANEIDTGKEFSWTVLKVGIPVDFSKTKDATLDCNNLPY